MKQQPKNAGAAVEFPFRLLFADYGNADARTPVIARANYEYYTFEYVVAGAGCLECAGQTMRLQKDSIYILHKHLDHRYWPDPAAPWRKIFFIVDGALAAELLSIHGLHRIFCAGNCNSLLRYFNEIMAICSSSSADKDLRGAALFHQFLVDLHAIIYAGNQIPEEISRLKQYFDENLERKIKLAGICRQLGRSKPHLIRLFKKYTGSAPYDYLMKKRIEQAKLMLVHSQVPIKEIAGKLQFSDQYYFSNYFKKIAGSSPSEFRKQFGMKISSEALSASKLSTSNLRSPKQ